MATKLFDRNPQIVVRDIINFMADILQEAHAPKNMRVAYRTLQQLYGEENIPLILGTEMHGAKTGMVSIEVGKDQMMLCLLDNYHEVPLEYRDSAPFFVLGHEFGHIIAHPGKDAVYWIKGMKELPVEQYQQGKWLNCISDILVNWTVTTATGVLQDSQKATIKRQMTDGWKASQFVRECGTKEGFFKAHRQLLKDKKVTDNRYQPQGGLSGQYDNPATGNKYEPTAMTPFYQKHIGHGRGAQYYPPINYCVATKMGDNWKKVKMLKDVDGLKLGKRYTVQDTKTYDGRTGSKEFEPISQFKIDGNGYRQDIAKPVALNVASLQRIHGIIGGIMCQERKWLLPQNQEEHGSIFSFKCLPLSGLWLIQVLSNMVRELLIVSRENNF